MGCLRRLFGLLIILLILMVTPCAFWAFNIDRVAMNAQTYKTALRSQNFYRTLLPMLVDSAAAMGSDSQNTQVHEAAQALTQNITSDEWALLSEKLLPPSWLQEQIDSNIDRLFSWLQGTTTNLDVHFDLSELKTKLTSTETAQVAEFIVPKLQPCSATDEAALAKGAATAEGELPILCKPGTDTLQKQVVTNLTNIFLVIGNQIPNEWRLIEHLKSSSGPSITYTDEEGNQVKRKFTDADLNRFRALAWLDSRLIVLLFLIPIALFAFVIMIAIRSSKQFFRWLGWGLILSGILTLALIPFISPALFGGLAMPVASAEAPAEGRMIVGGLVMGMITSITSSMTLAVFTQVAIVIVIGFIAVFISVVLRDAEPDVTRQELAMERSVLSNADLNAISGGMYYPAPTPTPSAKTPPPLPTPAPMANLSDATMIDDPLTDIFK
jgi:hypothetical protein